MKLLVILSFIVFVVLGCKENIITNLNKSTIYSEKSNNEGDSGALGGNPSVPDSPPSSPLFPSIFDPSIPIQTGGAANMHVRHTCGVTKSKNVLCWGSNPKGQLGDGSFEDRAMPVYVVGGQQGGELLQNVTAVAAGHSHTCAIDEKKEVYCWGEGGDVLGQGESVSDSNTPLKVKAGEQNLGLEHLKNISSIGLGYSYTCALSTAKKVYCWGARGRLGDGTFVSSSLPKAVLAGDSSNPKAPLENVKSIGVGHRNACAVTESHEPYCWGDARGTGSGITDRHALTPVRPLKGQQVGGDDVYLDNVRQITAGWNQACAATNDGAVYCWGREGTDFGHDGSLSTSPVRVLAGEQTEGNDGPYLGSVKQIEGSSLFCAITTKDELYCWGVTLPEKPAKVPSEHFDEGYVTNARSLSFVLGTAWFFDQEGRPFGLGFNFQGTFMEEEQNYLTSPYFLDIEE